MIRVVVINGYPGSGKDLFVQMCADFMGRGVENYHTSDPYKNVFRVLGWNGNKTDEVRNLMANFMRDCNAVLDTSFKAFTDLYYVACYEQHDTVIFVHCREPENIKRYVEKYGAITLIVDRDIFKLDRKPPDNNSDQNVKNYRYDVCVDNNGTQADLNAHAREFMSKLLTGKYDGGTK